MVLASSGEENYNKVLLCQLYESSSLLAQLGALISNGLEKLLINQGSMQEIFAEFNYRLTTEDDDVQAIEKRKHEYLRFGKRKHEYLRFGKRKHEYLRFGRK
ncbi:unnamed protein product [Thelazia callipaeda]|uniref:FMRFamide-related neuropeptide n=1 Tax=Thelazia callipaeda TaxID=103827 RepID=A0A0N5D3H3_THECL|nr:unnamed protein product [Thelazia callipaeda]